MDNVIQLCKKFNIEPIYIDINCHATGIGDILFRLLCMRNELIKEPFYINLNYFTNLYYNSEPLNQLEFRIKLIKDILKYNNIPEEMVKFTFHTNNTPLIQHMPYHLIENFTLKINDNNTLENINTEEYIIFHTKCRHFKTEDYSLLKQNIMTFCKNNKSKYKIIIMGERIFQYTEEVDLHGITTVYNELLELKNHNNIVDNSIENIYNNLDYDNYKKDVELIKNAKYNICFGIGGQFCTSVIFGKSTIVYCKIDQRLNTDYFKKNNFFFDNIEDFFNLIKEKCFI